MDIGAQAYPLVLCACDRKERGSIFLAMLRGATTGSILAGSHRQHRWRPALEVLALVFLVLVALLLLILAVAPPGA